jgi:hypothetical protein
MSECYTAELENEEKNGVEVKKAEKDDGTGEKTRTTHRDSVGICPAQARIKPFGLTFHVSQISLARDFALLREGQSFCEKQVICTNQLEKPKERGSTLSAVKQFRSAQ